MSKLYIKKKDLGKKIYKIEFSELVKEYFTVVADSKEEAEQKMWDIRSGFKNMDYDTADDHIVYDGYKDYLDDINNLTNIYFEIYNYIKLILINLTKIIQ